MTSDGYQTFQLQQRNAGSLLYQYHVFAARPSYRLRRRGHLNSNGPNISSTTLHALWLAAGLQLHQMRQCQRSPTGFNRYTGAGIKFLLTNNSDPASWFDYQYNTYQVPTDFEYVGLKTEFGKGWYLDLSPTPKLRQRRTLFERHGDYRGHDPGRRQSLTGSRHRYRRQRLQGLLRRRRHCSLRRAASPRRASPPFLAASTSTTAIANTARLRVVYADLGLRRFSRGHVV